MTKGKTNMPAIHTAIDHLVLVARSLEEGADFCERELGVRPGAGGEHPLMGTHNRLLALGGKNYLEVIAINPAAPAPKHRRWFGMDDMDLQKRTERGPSLAAFVAASNDVGACVEAMPELGVVQNLQRGDLRWQMALRDDGALLEGGTVPAVIQWPEDMHPTANMAPSGCRLLRLQAVHPEPQTLLAKWQCLGLDHAPLLECCAAEEEGEPYLAAYISTPRGVCFLQAK
jgi:hypothetical protein